MDCFPPSRRPQHARTSSPSSAPAHEDVRVQERLLREPFSSWLAQTLHLCSHCTERILLTRYSRDVRWLALARPDNRVERPAPCIIESINATPRSPSSAMKMHCTSGFINFITMHPELHPHVVRCRYIAHTPSSDIAFIALFTLKPFLYSRIASRLMSRPSALQGSTTLRSPQLTSLVNAVGGNR